MLVSGLALSNLKRIQFHQNMEALFWNKETSVTRGNIRQYTLLDFRKTIIPLGTSELL